MKSILRKSVWAPAVLLAATLAAGAAQAETTVNVPFSFTAAGQACPAGVYTVLHEDHGSFVTLIHKKSGQIFTWVVGPGAPQPDEKKISLQFDQVGDTHALRVVQLGSVVTARLDRKWLRDERRNSRLTGGR